MRDLVVVVDHIEDDQTKEGKPFKRIIDKQGAAHRVSQQLEDKWYMLQPDETLKLTYDTFTKGNKTFDYIKDVETVKDVFVREAAAKVAQSKSPKDVSIEAQVAVKAVTDLLVAGKELPNDIGPKYDEWLLRALTEGLK